MPRAFPSLYPDLPEMSRYYRVRRYDVGGVSVIIALHNLARGPALGGTRWRVVPYGSYEEAFEDALRLSAAMTLKNAIHRLPFGGGKAVVFADPAETDRQKFWCDYGSLLNRLNKSAPVFYTAEDMGVSSADMLALSQYTPYLGGLPEGVHEIFGGRLRKGSGGPMGMTAYGVERGMRACLARLFGSPSFKGRSVVISGVGNVGFGLLARLLDQPGSMPPKIFVADIDPEKVERALALGKDVESVPIHEAHKVDADIFAPCGPGGVITDLVAEELKSLAVAGSANNPLAHAGINQTLVDLRIVYAPDFVINGGGVIEVASELSKDGYAGSWVAGHTQRIYDLLLGIFREAEKEKMPPARVAECMAWERVQEARRA